MESFVFTVIGLVFAGLAAYRLAGGLARQYRADRARRTNLRALEREPHRAHESPEAVAERLDRSVSHALREDLTLTGAMLASISVAAVFAGRGIGYGELAVGLYTAGLVGIVVGVAIALVGGVVRVLASPLLKREDGREAS